MDCPGVKGSGTLPLPSRQGSPINLQWVHLDKQKAVQHVAQAGFTDSLCCVVGGFFVFVCLFWGFFQKLIQHKCEEHNDNVQILLRQNSCS